MKLTRRGLLWGASAAAAAAGAGAYGLWRWREGPALRALTLPELPAGEFDACVIGSGPAGAVLARRLVEQGLRTVVLESGVPVEEVAARGFDASALDVYAAEGDPLYPIHATRLRALGGASNLWTGRCSRLHPIDFEPNAYTPKDNPWPLRYADLQPWYAEAERVLRVRGGELSDLHAPRRAPLPGGDDSVDDLRAFLSDLDVVLDACPTSEAPRFHRGPVRAGRDLLPGLSQSPLASLVVDATVTRLSVDASGNVDGAEVRSTGGARRTLRAGVFVVACGALESARLLLLSASEAHPEGLGNRSGWLGRGFNEHPDLDFVGELPRESPGSALARSHQFYDAEKRAGLGSAIYVFGTSKRRPHVLRIGASVEMLPQRENGVALTPGKPDAFGSPGLRLAMRWSPEDRATLEATRARITGFFERLGASKVEEQPVSWSHHQIGTCRMGDDPGTSVVDAELRVHGTRNLYVLSSAVFVTGGAAHPTLAIVALGLRLAERLAREA